MSLQNDPGRNIKQWHISIATRLLFSKLSALSRQLICPFSSPGLRCPGSDNISGVLCAENKHTKKKKNRWKSKEFITCNLQLPYASLSDAPFGFLIWSQRKLENKTISFCNACLKKQETLYCSRLDFMGRYILLLSLNNNNNDDHINNN